MLKYTFNINTIFSIQFTKFLALRKFKIFIFTFIYINNIHITISNIVLHRREKLNNNTYKQNLK